MLNKAILIGNLGRDPEIRSSESGSRFATFSLATSDTWKNKAGERESRTEWHNISILNDGLVNVVERYLKKGSKVYLEGAIRTNKYTKDGVEKYSTNIVLFGFDSKLLMLDSKANKDIQEENNFDVNEDIQEENNSNTNSNNDIDDDIPF